MALLYKSTRLKPVSLYKDRWFNGTLEDRENALKRSSTLYVGNMSFYTTEEQVFDLFSKAGEVKRIVMGLDKFLKTPCGFCFVEYFTRRDAEASVRFLSGVKLDERVIRVDYDTGFEKGRQFGRGRSGGQVRDEYRTDYDPGRGGYGNIARMSPMEMWGGRGPTPGGGTPMGGGGPRGGGMFRGDRGPRGSGGSGTRNGSGGGHGPGGGRMAGGPGHGYGHGQGYGPNHGQGYRRGGQGYGNRTPGPRGPPGAMGERRGGRGRRGGYGGTPNRYGQGGRRGHDYSYEESNRRASFPSSQFDRNANPGAGRKRSRDMMNCGGSGTAGPAQRGFASAGNEIPVVVDRTGGGQETCDMEPEQAGDLEETPSKKAREVPAESETREEL